MNNPKSLIEIVEEYQTASDLAAKSLDTVPASTRGGWAVAIRTAQSSLPGLKAEYLSKILKGSVAVFTEGNAEKTKKFAGVAAEFGNSFTLDADLVFQQLADKIEPSIGPTKTFSVTQVSLLQRTLKDLVDDTGYTGDLGHIEIKTLVVVQDRQQLVDYIRELVARSNGPVVTVISLQNALLKQALAAKFVGKVLPVVIINSTPADRNTLAPLFSKSNTVDLDEVEEVNEAFVASTFKATARGREVQTIKLSDVGTLESVLDPASIS